MRSCVESATDHDRPLRLSGSGGWGRDTIRQISTTSLFGIRGVKLAGGCVTALQPDAASPFPWRNKVAFPNADLVPPSDYLLWNVSQ
jgi:hypothetical protein